MTNLLKSIINQVFPSIIMREANKILKEKINSEDNQMNGKTEDDLNKIPVEGFKKHYDQTFETKNRFEDKAKTNVMGITIAITVIIGASGLTNSLISRYPFYILQWLSFLILLAAIIYFLASGVYAIKVLFDENRMSVVDLTDLSMEDLNLKINYYDCINRNVHRNIIRNNVLYTSYLCIRNGLVCMVFLFVFASIPFTTLKNQDNKTFAFHESSILYSSTVIIPNEIDIDEINKRIIQDREDRGFIEDGTTYSFANISNNYCVQYKCIGSKIIVENFLCFDSVKSE